MHRDFNEFVEVIRDNLKDEGYDVVVESMTRSDGTAYTGIHKVEAGITPVIRLEDLYEQVYLTEGMVSVMAEVISIFNSPPPEHICPEDFLVWDKIQSKIYPRLVPNNSTYSDTPGVEIADLKVIFAVRAFSDDDGVGEAVVPNELFDMWKVKIEDVYSQAIANLAMEEYRVHNFGGAFEVLTNKLKRHGAVECLNPKVADKLKDKYIIPSSLDEVLLFDKDDIVTVDEMRAMVMEVNRSSIPEHMRLSDNVYELVDGKLEVVV